MRNDPLCEWSTVTRRHNAPAASPESGEDKGQSIVSTATPARRSGPFLQQGTGQCNWLTRFGWSRRCSSWGRETRPIMLWALAFWPPAEFPSRLIGLLPQSPPVTRTTHHLSTPPDILWFYLKMCNLSKFLWRVCVKLQNLYRNLDLIRKASAGFTCHQAANWVSLCLGLLVRQHPTSEHNSERYYRMFCSLTA